jgi:hypothetical protein
MNDHRSSEPGTFRRTNPVLSLRILAQSPLPSIISAFWTLFPSLKTRSIVPKGADASERCFHHFNCTPFCAAKAALPIIPSLEGKWFFTSPIFPAICLLLLSRSDTCMAQYIRKDWQEKVAALNTSPSGREGPSWSPIEASLAAKPQPQRLAVGVQALFSLGFLLVSTPF